MSSNWAREELQGRAVAAAVASGVLTFVMFASGSDLPPWRDADDLPLPTQARSVVVRRPEQPIVTEPRELANRRGTAEQGVRLPFFAAKRGPGCEARWILVGPEAWMCQDALEFDDGLPITPAAVSGGSWKLDAAPAGLPFRYYFVGGDGSNGYSRLDDAEDVAPDREYEPGFAVAVVDEAVKAAERYARTHHGLWLPMRDLIAVPPFSFHGEDARDGKLNFGWVVEDKAPVFAAPRAGKPLGFRARFEEVTVLEEQRDKAAAFYRVGEGAWMRSRDVRKPETVAPPDAVLDNERWLDVDLASQTLVAYEGRMPTFATLVSTGKGKEGEASATPRGEFRIWVKLLHSNMDNLEDEEAMRYYSIEDVPYVQYFASGVGLHGAFWHRGFGKVRSHGCVNLAPLDAQRLFAFTSPHLPAGWTAVLPTDAERGTLVRVR